MTMASVGQKIISFVYFTMIANHLGAEKTGKYFFALAFTTVFVVFVDLGLTSVLGRESAKQKENTVIFFHHTFSKNTSWCSHVYRRDDNNKSDGLSGRNQIPGLSFRHYHAV